MSHATLMLPYRSDSKLPALANRWALRVLNLALLGAGLAVVVSFVILAFAHLRDRYQVNFVSSVYTALAVRLNQGVFYPELYDGTNYAGTRYMPVQFVTHAGLAARNRVGSETRGGTRGGIGPGVIHA